MQLALENGCKKLHFAMIIDFYARYIMDFYVTHHREKLHKYSSYNNNYLNTHIIDNFITFGTHIIDDFITSQLAFLQSASKRGCINSKFMMIIIGMIIQ